MSESATDPAVIAERNACADIVLMLGRSMSSTALGEIVRAKRWTRRCANCHHAWEADEEWTPVMHDRAYCNCCGRVLDLVACPSCKTTATAPSRDGWHCAPCARDLNTPG